MTQEVTNDTPDAHMLETMAKRAKKALKVKKLTVVAQAGYYEGRNIVGCQNKGITPLVPKLSTLNNTAAGLFDKTDWPI